MTRWLWLVAPVLVVTLLVPLAVAVAVTALTPAVLLRTLHDRCVNDPAGCLSPTPTATPADPADAAAAALAFAAGKAGGPYRMGANGPVAYDCSSVTRAAYGAAGIRLPRTAADQRNWLAAGYGTRIPTGQERPGDLLFWDSYLGPHQIGHVALVWDPATLTTIEARNTRIGIGFFRYTLDHHRFEIWRPL